MTPPQTKRLLQELYTHHWTASSPGADLGCQRLSKELPFVEHLIASGTEKNGWISPPSWECTTAQLKKEGKIIYDGKLHPLGVPSYCLPFSGTVNLESLKKHLTFSSERPDSIPYHWEYLYRPHLRDWGLCVPKTLYDSLPSGNYEVNIEVTERPGAMKTLEHTLPGSSPDRIILHAHNCHSGQANDDLSGCVVGIELMKRLQKIPKRKYTVTLIISPELIGSFFWLDSLSEAERQRIKFGVMLKAVGNRSALKLQHSYTANTKIDRAASNVLRQADPSFTEAPFRRIYGNDETVFEAVGIPTISLTRYPFPEYHTSDDRPDIIDEGCLIETVTVLEQILENLDRDSALLKKFDGLLSLSHPRFGLYQPYVSPKEAQGSDAIRIKQSWHYLMSDMFQEFHGRTTILELAERYQLPFNDVLAYFEELKKAGAIEFVSA